MTAPVIIAKNLTGTPRLLTRTNVIVPALGTANLTDAASVYEIQADVSLYSFISSDVLILNDGNRDLSKEESLNLASPVVSSTPTLDVGQAVRLPIRNETGFTIPKGTAIAAFGYNSSLKIILVKAADKDDPSLRPAIAITEADLLDGDSGFGLADGLLSGVDTSLYSVTDQLVLGNAGALIRPPLETFPFSGEIQFIASVVRVHATEGILRVNAVQSLVKPPYENTVTVGTGGDFDTIEDAVAFVISSGASVSNWWEVQVGAGIYTENPITIPMGVSVFGRSENAVEVVAADGTLDLFTVEGGWLGNVLVSGVTDPGKSCVRVGNPAVQPSVLKNIQFKNCYNGVTVDGGAICYVLVASAFIAVPGQQIQNAVFLADGAGTQLSMSNINFYVPAAILPSYVGNPLQFGALATGGASIHCTSAYVDVATNDTTASIFQVEDDSQMLAFTIEARNVTASVFRIGATSGTIHVSGALLRNNTLDFEILSATGRIFASADIDDKNVSIVTGGILTGIIQTEAFNATFLTNEVFYVYPTERTFPLSDVIHDLYSSGLASGGVVTDGGGLNADVSAGVGWVRRPTDGDVTRVTWDADTLALTANATNFICYNGNTLALSVTTSAQGPESVTLAAVITDSSNIVFNHKTIFPIDGFLTTVNQYLLDTRKVILKSGLLVTPGSTTVKFATSSGSWYISLSLLTYAGSGGDTTFSTYYGSGVLQSSGITSVETTNYDNAGTLTPMTASYYRTDSVYLTSDGKISVIYGTAEYAVQADAAAVSAHSPYAFLAHTSIPLAKLVVQEGNGIVEMVDIRPTGAASTGSGGGGGTNDHSMLINLDADDHLQYLRTDGTRVMTGSLNVGGNNVTNVGLVDGVDVSAHALRHNPGGADAVSTAAAGAINVGAAAAEGTAAFLARSDHVHSLAAPSAPVDVTKAAASAGTSANVARQDHKHDVSTAAPGQGTGGGNSEGTATSLARSDHGHALRETGGPTDLTIGAIPAGGVVFRSGSTLVGLVQTNKTAVRAATTVAGTLASSFENGDVIDGVTLATGERILIKNQASGIENGIYVVAASGAPTRSLDLAAGASAAGVFVVVQKGTSNADTAWVCTTDSPLDVVGTDSLTFAKRGFALTSTAPSDVTKAAAAVGTSEEAARADHKHDVSTAVAGAATPGDAAAEGTATSLARSDHQHSLPAFGTTSGTFAQGNDARFTATPPLMWGNASVTGTTTTRYLTPNYTDATAPTSAIKIDLPRGGTVKNMRVRHNTTNGNGNAIVYTLRVNGTTSALTASVASTSATGSDLTHTVTVAAGDSLDIEVTKAASVATSPSDITLMVEFSS